jgi:hypothetical protein
MAGPPAANSDDVTSGGVSLDESCVQSELTAAVRETLARVDRNLNELQRRELREFVADLCDGD